MNKSPHVLGNWHGCGRVIANNFFIPVAKHQCRSPARPHQGNRVPGLASLPRADWAFLQELRQSDLAPGRLGAGGGGVHENLEAHPLFQSVSRSNWGVEGVASVTGAAGLAWISPLFACHFPAVALGQRIRQLAFPG